jgi:hypothetical protein
LHRRVEIITGGPENQSDTDGQEWSRATTECRFMAHRVISLPRGNAVAFRLKRTLAGFYEDTV